MEIKYGITNCKGISAKLASASILGLNTNIVVDRATFGTTFQDSRKYIQVHLSNQMAFFLVKDDNETCHMCSTIVFHDVKIPLQKAKNNHLYSYVGSLHHNRYTLLITGS